MRKLFNYMKGDYMASKEILKQKEATVKEITPEEYERRQNEEANKNKAPEKKPEPPKKVAEKKKTGNNLQAQLAKAVENGFRNASTMLQNSSFK